MSSHICQIIALPKEMLEEFKIETNVMCSLCSKVVKHKSALKIHMRKKHRVELDEECLLKQHPSLKTIPITKKAKRLEMCSCKFYCPIATCRYNISNQVKSKKLFSFPSFHSLKHHYNLNHMTKKYICTRCNKGYSIHSDLLSHTKLNCGRIWKCSCGRIYQTKQSLTKHLRAKLNNLEEKHEIEDMEKEEKEEELENEKLNDFYFQYSSSLSETSIKSTESAEAEEKLFSDLNNLDLEFGSIVFDY